MAFWRQERVDINTYVLNQKQCTKEEGYNKCLEGQARDITSRYEFTEILAAYQDVGNKLGTGYSCHDIMHHIAAIEYKKEKSLPQIFSECNSSCFSACYHGAVLGHFEDEGIEGYSPSELSHRLRTICDALGKEKNIFQYECMHGIGHALMLITGNELPNALSVCEKSINPEACYGGVFMENFPLSSTSDHPSKYLKSDDSIYPCNSIDEKYKSSCYAFLTSHLQVTKAWTYEEAFEKCDELFPQKYKRICFNSVGVSVIGNTEATFDNYYDVCKLIYEEEYRKACVEGVVASYHDRYKGMWDKYIGMFDFCSIVDDSYKETCYRKISEFAGEVFKDKNKREEACSRMKDKEYKSLCLG